MSNLEPRSENEDAYDHYLKEGGEKLRNAILFDELRVIEPAEPILCKRDTTVRAAIDQIQAALVHQGAVCVVDDDGLLIGIFSERDLMRRVLAKDLDVNTTQIGDVMTPNPIALSASDKIADALHYMADRGFRNLPIVKDGKPIGIVLTRHFVEFIVSLFPEDTLNRTESGRVKNPNAVYGG